MLTGDSPPRARAESAHDHLDGDQHGGADDDEQGADRERDVEVELEVLVDQQRQRLRDAAQVSGEHDRRPELADAASERQRGAGGEARLGERDADADERAQRARAVHARGVQHVAIERLERGDGLAQEERAGDEADRHHDCGRW